MLVITDNLIHSSDNIIEIYGVDVGCEFRFKGRNWVSLDLVLALL